MTAEGLSGRTPLPPIAFIDLGAQRDRIRGEIDAAIARVLDHGRFIMGPEVGELERALADFCGARHCITTSSGTDALVLALMAWGIGAGDAVFVPSFTFVATAEAPAMLGATPVMVDVREDSFNMDPISLERAVEAARRGGLRPSVVIPVDLFGYPADYSAIGAIAEANGLRVLADAAQSFGARTPAGSVGSLGDVTATSFFPAKPLGCYGDGGAIFTDDEDIADVLRSLRTHGGGRDKYDNVRLGLNGRLDTLQAAILLEKLKIYPDEIARRQAVADRYAAGLQAYVTTPQTESRTRPVWAQYTVRAADRDALAAACKAAGVPTAVYYPTPLHRQTAYAAWPVAPGGAPVSERLAAEVLSLPMHPYLDAAVQDRIIATVLDAVEQGATREIAAF